jgi:hypothetical protein
MPNDECRKNDEYPMTKPMPVAQALRAGTVIPAGGTGTSACAHFCLCHNMPLR